MGNGYMQSFATREEALAHAVQMNVEADSPLAFVAVYGPEDDFVVVDAETALDLGDGDIERVRVR